ncbi:nucleotidyltransferase domain-containing protein [Herminiimonas contaminans]|uniref:Nucleotidyltransferase n=1 Tax=Herminiimonas contaminans TaxID=1111140 RepID=A0ABS0EYN0_9BURK|nr:nucleotidyltransferase [Herminiimonas contaminans]MBF8179087.1 nucleotidyltransferase [Herminiimonas contaminans]
MDTTLLNKPQVDSWESLLLRSAAQISLSAPQYEKIKTRYENLQNILDATTDPLLQGAHIFIQGSIGLGTTLKPVPYAANEMATIDADAIVLLPNAANASAEQVLEAIEQRFRAGSRVGQPIKPLRRGVRIVYGDENPGFHIDITPARVVAGNTDQKGFGKLQVPDRETGWKASSPREYCNWLGEIAELKVITETHSFALDSNSRADTALTKSTQDPVPDYGEYMDSNPLKAAIKLLKRHRDVWAIANRKESIRPISAIITTLATHAYEEIARESAHRPLRPIEAMIEIVRRMPDFIDPIPAGYAVFNPKDDGENFAEKWNRPNGEGSKYRDAFYVWHARAVADMKLGFEDFGKAETFENAMNEQFGVSKAFVNDAIKKLPADWTLPGRKAGVTLNSISYAIFAGAAAASSASQAAIKPVDRLG